MADIFDPTQIGLEVGGGALIGGVIGFAAKKVAKIIAIIVGLELALFKFLETKGILVVNWEAIGGAAADAGGQAAEAPGWIVSLLAALPVTAGFTGGFLVGFKKG
jgi:uncharacterized membrane protein (Fun14 family)